MLITSRKRGDEIYLAMPDGTTVFVKVMETGSGRVRLAICAPDTVVIVRGELLSEEQRASRLRDAGVSQIDTASGEQS